MTRQDMYIEAGILNAYWPNIDIVTIMAMMTDDECMKHLQRYRDRAAKEFPDD